MKTTKKIVLTLSASRGGVPLRPGNDGGIVDEWIAADAAPVTVRQRHPKRNQRVCLLLGLRKQQQTQSPLIVYEVTWLPRFVGPERRFVHVNICQL